MDIVRYLLSYTYSSSNNYLEDKELTNSAVRNILAELVNSSGLPHTSSFVESTVESQPERFSRHPGQNVEMKRGDWICTRYVVDIFIYQLNSCMPHRLTLKCQLISTSSLPRCDTAKIYTLVFLCCSRVLHKHASM